MTVADILVNHCEPVDATSIVRCRICGRQGFGIIEEPSSFVVAYQLRNGTGFCIACGSAWKYKPFRNRSWIATPSSLTWINADTNGMELVRTAIESRDEPTAIQLTFSGQKHTWLASPWGVSDPGMKGVFVYTDTCDKPIFLATSAAREMADHITTLCELGVGKTESQQARFSSRTYQKFIEQVNFIQFIEDNYHGRLDWYIATAIYWRSDKNARADRGASRLEKTQVEESG